MGVKQCLMRMRDATTYVDAADFGVCFLIVDRERCVPNDVLRTWPADRFWKVILSISV